MKRPALIPGAEEWDIKFYGGDFEDLPLKICVPA